MIQVKLWLPHHVGRKEAALDAVKVARVPSEERIDPPYVEVGGDGGQIITLVLKRNKKRGVAINRREV